MKVTVIGAGPLGAQITQRLVRSGHLVVLADFDGDRSREVVEDIADAIALEDQEPATSALHRPAPRIRGISFRKRDLHHTEGSDVVVYAAGTPGDDPVTADPHMATEAARWAEDGGSAEAVVIVASAPVERMCAAVEAAGYAPRQIVGTTGTVLSARFARLIASRLHTDVASVDATVFGGYGAALAPLVRLATANGEPILSQRPGDAWIDGVVHDLRASERSSRQSVVGHAAAALRLVAAIDRGDDTVYPCTVRCGGEYGLPDGYVGLNARLGCRGVRIEEERLNQTELDRLHAAARELRRLTMPRR